MKKIALLFIVILALFLCVFVGCRNKVSVPEKPDGTGLEFWIAEDVSSVDFSNYCEKAGHFGAREYYGKQYAPVGVDENGIAIDLPYYVKYLISAYPDYSDGGAYVTRIIITDPNVTVYGISCNSTFEQFDKAMKENGYDVNYSADVTTSNSAQHYTEHTAQLGKARVSLSENGDEKKLVIQVTVTNKHNIVF